MGASYYFLGGIIEEEEKRGRIPRMETLPLGFGLFLFAYPTIVAFLVKGSTYEPIVVLSTAGLLFIAGIKLEKTVRKSEKFENHSV
jgi:hypothetical protein